MRTSGSVLAALRRSGAAAAVLLAAAVFAPTPLAYALQPPEVLVGPPPPDGPPGPELPMTPHHGCLGVGVLPQSDLTQVPQPEQMLNLKKARTLSRGAGVIVAVLDTGVSPDPRLPHLLGGGDYVTAGDGLSDCDAHGTMVAGIIGAAPSNTDGLTGVAPDAEILSIRYRSDAFDFNLPNNSDSSLPNSLTVRTMARAITHAANLGARVILVSVPLCLAVDAPVDQSMLAAALGYAVHTRDAVVIAGAGDSESSGCAQNPDIDPSQPSDIRNWRHVKTISTPGWYGSDVVTVGATSPSGVPMSNTLLGPWVSLGAPGSGIESVGPGSGNLINGVGQAGKLTPVGGASYAAAYVAGTAALLRSRFPDENASDIVSRLLGSAHAPARGVDDTIGAGVIDPVTALGYQVPPRAPRGVDKAAVLAMPKPPRPADLHPGFVAAAVIVVVVALGAGIAGTDSVIRRRR